MTSHIRRSQWSSGNMPDCGVRGPKGSNPTVGSCMLIVNITVIVVIIIIIIVVVVVVVVVAVLNIKLLRFLPIIAVGFGPPVRFLVFFCDYWAWSLSAIIVSRRRRTSFNRTPNRSPPAELTRLFLCRSPILPRRTGHLVLRRRARARDV